MERSPMRKIAPSAVIDPACELPSDIEVGHGCLIERGVSIGPGCRLLANVVLMGNTSIGSGNLFYPNCVIGAPPQDLKHDGHDTRLVIGNENVFRECVTVHTGTTLGGGETRIGHHNQFQVGAHLAHDVQVGDHCVLSNCVQVAGHAHISDHVTISGLVGIHQFVTLGRYCFVAGLCRCVTDVPPFLLLNHDSTLMGVNVKGMNRWGFSEEETARLKATYRQLFPRRGRESENGGLRNLYAMLFSRRARRSALSLSRRIVDVESAGPLDPNSRHLIDFLKASLNDGVFGRQLESKRRDAGLPPPSFFSAASALRETPA